MSEDGSKNLCKAFKKIGIATARADLIFKKAVKDMDNLVINNSRRYGMSMHLPIQDKPKKKLLSQAINASLASQI